MSDTDADRAERFRILNQQRCAEAMQLLYQTYIIDTTIAEDRGLAIQAINRMILALGGEDTAAKIEAVPYTARLRESGEPELVQLAKDLKEAIQQTEAQMTRSTSTEQHGRGNSHGRDDALQELRRDLMRFEALPPQSPEAVWDWAQKANAHIHDLLRSTSAPQPLGKSPRERGFADVPPIPNTPLSETGRGDTAKELADDIEKSVFQQDGGDGWWVIRKEDAPTIIAALRSHGGTAQSRSESNSESNAAGQVKPHTETDVPEADPAPAAPSEKVKRMSEFASIIRQIRDRGEDPYCGFEEILCDIIHQLERELAQHKKALEAAASQIEHYESLVSASEDMESMRVTLGCCLALMAQSGNSGCEEMARRIPFTIKDGQPYALVGLARTNGR